MSIIKAVGIDLAKLPLCIIGMEAYSGAHYRQNEKNDANDAEAICETVTRPKTHSVSIKSEEQQVVLCLHRIRQGAIKDRTTRINRLLGLLSEFGIIMPKGRYPAQHAIVNQMKDEND